MDRSNEPSLRKHNNQQAGLLALALGGPPVWVRSMGGGSLVWRAVVFVGRAAHCDGKVGDLRDVGRDGGIRCGGGGGGGDGGEDDKIMGRGMGRGRGRGSTVRINLLDN